jgi:DNA-binding FrmR family transcriptional regulator
MHKLKPPPRDAVTKRLKRASGHLGAVLSLVEKQRSSLQVAQQLAAVEAALAAARQQVVQEQMQVCLDGGQVEGPTLRQLRAIARFL